MSTPLIGRNAVIQMGTTTIGYAQGMTTDLNVDLIKEFAFNSDKAAVLAAGNKHFKVSCDRMFIDGTYATQVLGGTPVNFIIGPAGTTTGSVKLTISNVVLTVWSWKADPKGIVTEKVQGEGNNLTVGTF
jgi:hypothetical protein